MLHWPKVAQNHIIVDIELGIGFWATFRELRAYFEVISRDISVYRVLL